MKKINLLAISLILYSFAYTCNASPLQVSAVKKEFELKLSLTESGFQKFKNLFVEHYNATVMNREDLYFDIFENHHFILKNFTSPIKLRFQDSKWQIQKSVSLETLGAITAKASYSQTIEVSDGDYKEIRKMVMRYHHELSEFNNHALSLAEEIQSKLLELKLLKKAVVLCPNCTEEQHYYSAQTNSKKRYKIKQVLDNVEFSIFVGVTTLQYQQKTYEIEAELKNSEDTKKALGLLKSWLISEGLTSADIFTETSPDATIQVEQNLIQLGL